MRNFFVITVLFMLVGTVNSQVINIEGKRFLKDTNGFTGKTDLSYTINRNVQEIIVFGMNVHAQYRHNRQRLLFISDLNFIKAGTLDFVNAGYIHGRYSVKVTNLITLESFLQAQYNRVLLLDRRYLAGAGPRFRVVKKENIRVYAASLYMYEYQSQANDTIEKYTHRISNYVTATLDFKRVDFTTTIFYQPSLAELSDFRIASDTAFELELTNRLNYKTGFNLLFDTRQPPGVPAMTYIIRNGITFRL